ncbi:hypothetical protein CSC94_09400 [Zhengella mangrovi]|uniref:Murein endopeptidase K n=1 Tax=Zhengella mangrovi TaxID=1982044 RepID=A0A2G1QP43_9HYPH|nr:DUF882 domain-containing protein [Zhengella mangrovi]PHP67249.1 hypothetical protein CSC94_09400 [Zhengella mangrovi]
MTASAARFLQVVLAGLLIGVALLVASTAARAETRSLKLYYMHTGEKAEIVFKKNGHYVKSGLQKLNHFLRDFRRNEPTKMDPRLFDLVWAVYKKVGASNYIHVVSGYRSPATNSMLRRTRGGQAKKSQHMYGRAMDFFIPGVKLSKLRAVAMKMQVGGVGYYPRSGSPFVHLDVARVRAWPRMSRKELVRLFPDGKTLHLPADGKPLKGYQQALASYKKRKGKPIIVDDTGSSSGGGTSLLASLFGGDDTRRTQQNPRAPRRVAAAPAAAPTTAPRPAEAPAAAPEPAPAEPERPVATPETILAALPRTSVPIPRFADRPDVQGEPVDVAVNRVEDDIQAEMDADVPIPSRRPDDAPSTDAVRSLLAAADSDAADSDAGGMITAVAPTARPRNDSEAVLASLGRNDRLAPSAQASALAVPMPSTRPGSSGVAEDRPEVTMAALPTPTFRESAGGKGGRVTASPRTEASKARSPQERLAAVLGGVRTTRKEGRATAEMAKPDPRPVVRPIQPDDARWALAAAASVQPLQARDARVGETLRAKPQEVIAVGFSPDLGQQNHNRFTGKAVSFLSVVRFRDTN